METDGIIFRDVCVHEDRLYVLVEHPRWFEVQILDAETQQHLASFGICPRSALFRKTMCIDVSTRSLVLVAWTGIRVHNLDTGEFRMASHIGGDLWDSEHVFCHG